MEDQRDDATRHPARTDNPGHDAAEAYSKPILFVNVGDHELWLDVHALICPDVSGLSFFSLPSLGAVE